MNKIVRMDDVTTSARFYAKMNQPRVPNDDRCQTVLPCEIAVCDGQRSSVNEAKVLDEPIQGFEPGTTHLKLQAPFCRLAMAMRNVFKSMTRSKKTYDRRVSFVRSGAPSPEIRWNSSALVFESDAT